MVLMIAYRDFKSAAGCIGVVFREAEGAKKSRTSQKIREKREIPEFTVARQAAKKKKC